MLTIELEAVASDNYYCCVGCRTDRSVFMREMRAVLFLSFSSFSVSFKVQVEQIQRSSQNTGQTFP